MKEMTRMDVTLSWGGLKGFSPVILMVGFSLMSCVMPGEMTQRLIENGPPILESSHSSGGLTVERWTLGLSLIHI